MEIFASGRQTGKTTKLIELAAESETKGEPCYIVCSTHREAYRIAQQAKEMRLKIDFPLTYEEFLTSRGRAHHYYIDNVEMLMQMIAGGSEIRAITVNLKEPPND